MPTINVSYKVLKELVGIDMSLDELRDKLMLIKCEVDNVEDDTLSIEVNSDRIDMLSVEGVARQLKGFLGLELGIPKYDVVDRPITVFVENSVKRVRPYIKVAMVELKDMDEEILVQIMQLQEKLHKTWCRDRKKASIGVYDFDKIRSPITYKALKPDEIKFVPLEESEEMNGWEILEQNPKGRMYSHLLKDAEVFPILLDSRGTVLSMPPIINSEDTKVTVDSKRLFIDVTGTSPKTVDYALNVMVSNIAERGAKICRLEVRYWDGKVEKTPNLSNRKMYVESEFIRKVSGLNLNDEEILQLLRKSRLDGSIVRDGEIEVIIPPYRCDFLHQVDVVEDILISYGYDKIPFELPETFTIGREHEIETLSSIVRDIMVGAGFQEVRNYVLTNKSFLFDRMLRKYRDVVEVENPISVLYSSLRDMLVPGLLNFLSFNLHVPLPHKIFEVGDVILVREGLESKTEQHTHLAAAISDDSVSFEEIHSVLDRLMMQTVGNYELREGSYPFLIEGRCADVLIRGRKVGFIGEVNPQVILNFGINTPCAVFEVNLTEMNTLLKEEGL
ncbi:MAG: phenylalanine--tRNA ligase subunit beta [Candidatus Asgardarchaeia archaeon]